jgi:hypothetical protein
MTDDDSSILRLHHLFASPLDWQAYRSIMGDLWRPLLQSLLAARAYPEGADFALRLLEASDQYREHLTPELYRQHRTTLYIFLLTMLDRSDNWEGYLAAWQDIREKTGLTFTYNARKLEQDVAIRPFVIGQIQEPPLRPSELTEDRECAPLVDLIKFEIGEDTTYLRLGDNTHETIAGSDNSSTIRVHFLWIQEHRRQVILRKLERQRAGKRTGNLRHGTAKDLSAQEIERRLEWIWARAREGGPRWDG